MRVARDERFDYFLGEAIGLDLCTSNGTFLTTKEAQIDATPTKNVVAWRNGVRIVENVMTNAADNSHYVDRLAGFFSV